MKRKKDLFSAVSAVSAFMCTVFIIVGLTGCGSGSNSGPKKSAKKKNDAIPVEVTKVKRGSISAYFTGTASLEPEGEARVVSKVSGEVKQIFVEEGDKVKENQILAKLDDDQLKLNLEEATARLNKLEKDFKRYKELYDKKIVSAEAYEQARADYDMQKTKVGQAKLQVGYTSIKAPISGVIATRFIKKGNMLPVNSDCFHISDFDPLHAILHVPEKEMSKLQKNQQAKLTVDALPDDVFTGKILRISPVVDPQTGTFKVTIEVDDEEEKLKPGMFSRVRIVYDQHLDTMLVPKDAILVEGDESVVFVVREEFKKEEEDKKGGDKNSDKNSIGKKKEPKKEKKKVTVARRVIVKTGYINTLNTEVIKGIKVGDVVVHTGIGALKDGSQVDILEPGQKQKTVTAKNNGKDQKGTGN